MRVALLVLVTGCVVIRAPELAERPRWRITGHDQLDTDCAIARALVRKSGKQGIGMAVQLRSRMDCTFATSLALVLPARPRAANAAAVVMHGRSQLYRVAAARLRQQRGVEPRRDPTACSHFRIRQAQTGTWSTRCAAMKVVLLATPCTDYSCRATRRTKSGLRSPCCTRTAIRRATSRPRIPGFSTIAACSRRILAAPALHVA